MSYHIADKLTKTHGKKYAMKLMRLKRGIYYTSVGVKSLINDRKKRFAICPKRYQKNPVAASRENSEGDNGHRKCRKYPKEP